MLVFEFGLALGSKGGFACRFRFGFRLCGISEDETGELTGTGETFPLLIDRERMAVCREACPESC